MSNILNKLNFFSEEVDLFSKSHGILINENRDWERSYRNRWQHDKVVRSTHGVNCTGSCSWKIYVKRGFITKTALSGKSFYGVLFHGFPIGKQKYGFFDAK